MKILILGPPASGKTSKAKELAKTFNISHIEVDKLYWKENKGGETRPSFEQDLKTALEKESFILEGKSKLSLKFLNCSPDKIYLLQPPKWKLVLRSILRLVKTGNWVDLKMNLASKTAIDQKKLSLQCQEKFQCPVILETN